MSKLVETLTRLIQSPQPASRELRGKLTLAYTPPDLNEKMPGHGRLVCSRLNSVPSSDEVEIVVRDLKKALIGQKRPFDQFWVSGVKARGAWSYVAIEWHEGVQEELVNDF